MTDDPPLRNPTWVAARVRGENSAPLRYEGASDRRRTIVELAQRTGFVSAGELSQMLGVSEMTIRRDIRRLADEDLLRAVHGGASAGPQTLGGVDFQDRGTQRLEIKQAIALEAARMVPSGSAIAIDAGTTTLALARVLPADKELTVVTQSLPALATLAGRRGIDLHALGGHFHDGTQSFTGPQTVGAIRTLRIGMLFLAASSIRAGEMYTNISYDVEVKRALIEASENTIILADSSKFAVTAALHVASTSIASTLVSDVGLDPEASAALKEMGVSVVTVDPAVHVNQLGNQREGRC